MSFLAGGRLAGKEAAFFFQESKQAVNRLTDKLSASAKTPPNPISSAANNNNQESQADVLPEILKHSLPSYIYGKPSDSSSLSTASKWVLQSNDPNKPFVSPDLINPLRAYVSLPQVTFGPKRWELPSQENSVSASTANELRKDRYAPINPEKLKAAAEGLTQVGKAFAVATAVVFGGATLVFSCAVSKLKMNNSDDIKSNVNDLVQPKFDMIRGKLAPLRRWTEDTTKKWHASKEENIKEKPMVKELSKIFGAKTSH
ncbi:uncharacterized protein LOC126656652 [Mercurialis annua]|uniref:uncharacterized protein LOC126656652 n=1 Tax=Mercurialis annua TaxID=3986 RepID=UPI002160FDD9|nr:uncharacterized protein LOC126656652 [Mercurialis annua]